MVTFKKLSTAIASGAVLLGTMAPGAFANTITVSGNGAFSQNGVEYSQSHSTAVVQSNESSVTNAVSVNNNTGGNSSNFGTGGSSSINTGNAVSTVDIVNEGNANIATIPSCGCNEGANVSVHGNGAFSHNFVGVDLSHEMLVAQSNSSDITNLVDVDNKTGNNHSDYNTNSSGLFGHGWDQEDWWNWYWEHQVNKTMDWNQFHTWFMNLHDSGGHSSINTGDAFSHVSITNEGSQNLLH